MKIIFFRNIFFLKITLFFLMNVFIKNFVFAQQISQNNFLILPEIIENFSKPLRLGTHDLKVWGFKIYNIQLLSEKKEFSYQNKFAIIINYQRDFTKKDLINKSLDEISRINNIKDKALIKIYKNKLEEIFLDIKKGDRKTAFFDPKYGIKLYFNGKFIGKIDDLIFAKRFVDIWLSDKSSYPKMTKDILGKNE